jgi:4-hydroxybenzoate polyprenyltransferase
VAHRATARAVDPAGLALALCGILAAYSVDRLIDGKDTAHGSWLPRVLRIGATASVAAGLILFALVPLQTALLVPLLGLIVLWYSRLKRLPLLKTALVSGAWTWSILALPFHDNSWFGWRVWLTPVAIPLTLLTASGCLLCDLKDVDRDRAANVTSAPVLLGVHRTIAIATVLALLASAVALAEHRLGLSVAGLGLGVLALHPGRLARDITGPLLVDVTLTVPGLLIALQII